jgi:hypothetical protein
LSSECRTSRMGSIRAAHAEVMMVAFLRPLLMESALFRFRPIK